MSVINLKKKNKVAEISLLWRGDVWDDTWSEGSMYVDIEGKWKTSFHLLLSNFNKICL